MEQYYICVTNIYSSYFRLKPTHLAIRVENYILTLSVKQLPEYYQPGYLQTFQSRGYRMRLSFPFLNGVFFSDVKDSFIGPEPVFNWAGCWVSFLCILLFVAKTESNKVWNLNTFQAEGLTFCMFFPRFTGVRLNRF